MISILLPTRKRPAQLRRMVESARSTAIGDIEIIAYVDDDDPLTVATCDELAVKRHVAPRIGNITDCWNRIIYLATGDIFMQGNDDIVFRTKGWNVIVEREIEKFDDRIVMVHGSDEGQHFDRFGAHPFVHRRWYDVLGYFTPPYFSSDYGDTWINCLADAVKRRRYVPIVVEHLHFLFKKAPVDEVTRERLERHKRDHVEAIWARKTEERERDARRLGAAMYPPFVPQFTRHPAGRGLPLHLNKGGRGV